MPDPRGPIHFFFGDNLVEPAGTNPNHRGDHKAEQKEIEPDACRHLPCAAGPSARASIKLRRTVIGVVSGGMIFAAAILPVPAGSVGYASSLRPDQPADQTAQPSGGSPGQGASVAPDGTLVSRLRSTGLLKPLGLPEQPQQAPASPRDQQEQPTQQTAADQPAPTAPPAKTPQPTPTASPTQTPTITPSPAPDATRVAPSSRGDRPADMSIPNGFIATVAAAAQQSMADTGVPASVTIAQAILESDWGRSALSKVANNYFGIKATKGPGPAGVVNMNTWEVMGGQNVTVVDGFKAYHNLLESILDHGRFLSDNPRYAAAFKVTNDANEFARRIHAAGYATDPAYSSKLINLMTKYNLYQYDAITSTTSNPAS